MGGVKMDQLNLWLGLLFMATLAALIMPGVLAANRGKMLRNIAIWLGIFLALALIYRNLGPFDTASRQLPPTIQAAPEDAPARPPQEHIELNK